MDPHYASTDPDPHRGSGSGPRRLKSLNKTGTEWQSENFKNQNVTVPVRYLTILL